MNNIRLTSLLLLLSLLIIPLSSCDRKEPRTDLDTSFESNPMFDGWTPVAQHQFMETNSWTPPDKKENTPGYITSKKGRWHSPTLKVDPFQYYRLVLETRTPERAFWAVKFYNNRAEIDSADVYSDIFASESWRKDEFVFMAEKESAGVNLFVKKKGKEKPPVDVSRVKIEPISDKNVLNWADTLYEELPELNYEPPAERHSKIQSTIQKLKNGKQVDIVMLGDSIANDMSNGTPDILLERAYPKADVRWISSVASGKGAWYYKKKNRVQEYVIRHDPDLLIIGGVSHRADTDSIQTVIEQVRAKIDPDILVIPGVITPLAESEGWIKGLARKSDMTREEARKALETFPERLKEKAKELDVEFANVRNAWDQYIEASEKPREWFMRDGIHGNVRGKQIAARILIRYLSPPENN